MVSQVTADTSRVDDKPVIGIGQKHTFHSSILGEEVVLVVSLPESYGTGDTNYPVLFLLGSDFRDYFALSSSFLKYMKDLEQIPEMILVGIDLPRGNGVLIPREVDEGTASADKHIRLLSEEIIPFVEKAFRTNGYRILYGVSNSGIFTIYALASGKLPFQAYFAGSPMIGWSSNLIFSRTKQALSDVSRQKQFLYLIESDNDFEEVTQYFPDFVKLLEQEAPAWLDWKSEIRSSEGHVPEVSLPFALRAWLRYYTPSVSA